MHTESDGLRQLLHREVAGTLALLTDEQDFTAMRHYRTFAFQDHHAYLRQAEALLRGLAAEGRHTAVALFDPEEYTDYCAGSGLDPDTSAGRARFTAELAATGTTVVYEGQPLADLVPALVATALRQATWEYATTVLAAIGTCATCGEDIGWSCYERACELVARVLDRAGPGTHHLVCSAATSAASRTTTGASAGPGTLLSALDVTCDPRGRPVVDERQIREFAAVLACGIATRSAGGLVVRTLHRKAGEAPEAGAGHGRRDREAQARVYGWRLDGWNLRPLTAAEVFDAYCTDVDSGDPVPPEPGVDYTTPPALGEDPPPAGHDH